MMVFRDSRYIFELMPTEQIVFIILLVAAFGFFAWTMRKIMAKLLKAKPLGRWDQIGERIKITLMVAFGQSKMVRKPVAGILHSIIWWGFLVITVGTVEMIIDGITGTDRVLSGLSGFYGAITASGEVFAALIIPACLIFLFRRWFWNVKRFKAPEMKPGSRYDATLILTLILLLMVSLLGMNVGYLGTHGLDAEGVFPVSHLIFHNMGGFTAANLERVEVVNWWIHITLILIFLNILPYSKHFHVIMAVPNVFFSRLEPKAKLDSMEAVTKEVKLMMDPETAYAPVPEGEAAPERFGTKDFKDVSWKNLLDAYTCTECGRCTDVCPANNTGKKLSPRKLYIDLRASSKDNISGESKSLVGGLISEEELWACTGCMACMEECPVNIDHLPFIMDMRRNLVMEESKAPNELNLMFTNIENNGAPWQFSPEDRLKWADELLGTPPDTILANEPE